MAAQSSGEARVDASVAGLVLENGMKAEFGAIRSLLRKRAGIVLEPSQDYLIETRLGPVARSAGFASISALDAALAGLPEVSLATAVVEALTTHETSFFRDNSPFELLRTKVLPRLIESRRSLKSLRIWSAACSSGQEPYSLAMLLDAEFPQLASWQVSILATDLSNSVLETARRGVYHAIEVGRGLPKKYQQKYFVQQGESWAVVPALRTRITFKQLNLVESLPALMPMFDVVMCRNVLIYFDAATRVSILTRIRKHVAEDGLLFVGSAETTVSPNAPFQRSDYGLAGCFAPKKPAA
jgi:chemotaxis protein methyltransferase CheR